MKKFFLFAAAAAAMMSANAQPTIEQMWRVDGMASLAPTADCRQGFGMNGKVYINNKADQKVLVFAESGLTNEELPGGANTGCTRDEAGNIVTILNGFGANWACDGETPTVQVVNPNDPTQVKQYCLPAEVASVPVDGPIGFGRCDLLGFAKGDLLNNGVIYFAPSTSGCKSLVVMTITNGAVNLDETYEATIDGVVYETSSTPVNYYINANGDERLLYVYRSGAPKILMADGDNFAVESGLTLPGKSASNGAQIFVWNGEEYVVYPYGGNYLDGFAIVKMGETEALYVKEPELQTNPNGFQCNWVNAEVTDDGVMIYHYVPGAYLEVFKMSQAGTVNDGDVNEDGDINVVDITALIDVIMNDGDNPRADVNNDGQINVMDITALIDIIMNS